MNIGSIRERADLESIRFLDDISGEYCKNRTVIRFMIDNLHEPFILCQWGQNGNIPIIDFNPLAVKFLGYGPEVLFGKNLYEVFSPESISLARKSVSRFPKEKSSLCEGIVINEEGQKIKVEVTHYVFKLKEGIQVLMSVRDLSPERKESESLKNSFLTNLSHEIRTPMNSIIGFSQLMIQPQLPRESMEEYASIVSQSCDQLLDVINDILDISRLETDQVKLEMSEIKMSDLLKNTLKQFKPVASKKKLDFRLNSELLNEDLILTSDYAKLNKILSILIGNALKFTSRGYIELGCYKKDSYFEFYVKDTGIGIPSSDHEIIFESFRQSENGPSQFPAGTGLGLSITRSFVTMLGGTIWVDSKIGEGSVFYFTIPNNANINTDLKTNDHEIVHSCKYSKTCLVVDDNELNYIYLEALLLPLGFQVLWAKDGEDAIFMALNEPVDIVLMDLKMPNIDGYEATKIIKSKLPELPIIAQTACALTDERDRAIHAGCDDYLTKPIKKEIFLQKVDLFLNMII